MRSGRRCRGFVQDSVMNREQSEFKTVGNADLVIYVAQIVLDDLFGCSQLSRDFLVLVSLNNERNNAKLFRGQAITHAQSDHIVFGQFTGYGDVLDPGLAAGHFAYAIDQS